MARTHITEHDLPILFKGHAIYRDEFGQPANPPSGETMTGRNAIEVAFAPDAIRALKQLIKPNLLESFFPSSPADE